VGRSSLAWLVVCLVALAGCHRGAQRSASTDASASSAVATTAATAAGLAPPKPESSTCPEPVHPGYCRHRCRTLAERSHTMHARRIRHAARAGLGTCGVYRVFAEDERQDDGGTGAGVVEYFDPRGELVAATDGRLSPCGRFGPVPACTPRIAWGLGRVSLHFGPTTIARGLPPEVVTRIARRNTGRFRACMADAAGDGGVLGEGRVVLDLAIAKDGAVSAVKDAGSTLADRGVVECMRASLRGLTFPQPADARPVTARITLVVAR
jgi:hypothetical protein